MNLIDRYIAQVGKHLPKRNRVDIQKEIRSTLEDMLEDRSQQAGHPADEEMMITLLKEFGKPEDVATSYMPAQQLIGPQLYPIYLLILKIVLPIVSTVLLVTAGIELATASLPGTEMVEAAGKALLDVASAVISAVGSITITFAILDRIPGFRSEIEKDKKSEEKEWDPRRLPEVRDVEKFSIPGLVVEIALSAAAVIIFNFYAHIIGLGFLLDGKWVFFSVLSDAFFHYLPYLNILWGLEIILNLVLLRQGRWQPATRWFSAAVKIASVGIGTVMLLGPSLVELTPAMVTELGSLAGILTYSFNLTARIVLAIIIVLEGIELVEIIPPLLMKKP